MEQKAFVLGLTGNSGAGKTHACGLFAESGFSIVNCDEIAHKALDEPRCIADVKAFFGSDIMINEKLNRSKIAAFIFTDDDTKERYLDIVFPYIIGGIAQFVRGCKPPVLLDAPTLFESGLDTVCDRIVAIVCDTDVAKARIITRDRLSSSEADARLRNGKGIDFYSDRCDVVIENNGTLDEFENVIRELTAKWHSDEYAADVKEKVFEEVST